MNTTHLLINILLAACLPCFANSPEISVKITNPTTKDRKGEVVEISDSKVRIFANLPVTVKDINGALIPSQMTHEGNILIFGDFPAQQTRQFFVTASDKDKMMETDTICVGQIRHDKQDDYAWENDRGGYRLYGPSYRQGGGKVSGYDIWTKSVGYPTLKQRYDDHDKYGMSYHKDFGSGMDVYTVGPTLGAGMNALMAADSICYPVAYENCEILDNGPFRVTAKITCYPETIGNDKVVETRIISLDRGEWLNRTVVKYDGLKNPYPLTTGIVVHKQNKRGYAIDPEKRHLAYVDLTDNPDKGNGAIFIGIVNPQLPDSISFVPFDKEIADGVGQIQTFSTYDPNSEYTYYWGSGWSKRAAKGLDDWRNYLSDFYDRLHEPFHVAIE